MSIEELCTFVTAVRAEIDATLARLDTVDPTTLPPDLRATYERMHRSWEELRALTEGYVITLQEADPLRAGVLGLH